MKLGIIITGLGTGGAENHLLKILPRLDLDLFIVSLTNEDDIGKVLKKKGIKVYYLGLRKDLLNILTVISRFRKVIKDERPDVLNSYLIHANLFTRIFGRIFGVKKIICSVRNKHIDKPFLMFLDRITSGLVDLYLPNSEAVANFMISKGFSQEKIKVIPNGIDFDNFPYISASEKEKLKKGLGVLGKKVIGTVGSLKPKKDQATLIKAFAKLDESFALLIVGEGELRGKLEKLAGDLGVASRVRFLGRRNDAKELMQVMDIFVLPSLHEGMSNALLEAMAAGCKVVVSDIEENVEVAGKENSFRVGDEGELVEKISVRLKERELLMENIIDRYDINKTTKDYNKIITIQDGY